MLAQAQYQFGNSLAVTVYVQDLTATWAATANCGVFVNQLALVAAAEVTLHNLCNVVAGKVSVSCTDGKAVAADLADKIRRLQKQCQQDGKCGNVVVTTNPTASVAHIGKLTLIPSDLILARIHGGIFATSQAQVHRDM
jgi:hypothetical protein